MVLASNSPCVTQRDSCAFCHGAASPRALRQASPAGLGPSQRRQKCGDIKIEVTACDDSGHTARPLLSRSLGCLQASGRGALLIAGLLEMAQAQMLPSVSRAEDTIAGSSESHPLRVWCSRRRSYCLGSSRCGECKDWCALCGAHSLFYYLVFIFFEFIGVTLAREILQVSALCHVQVMYYTVLQYLACIAEWGHSPF